MISLILAYASIIDIIYEHNEVFFGTKKKYKKQTKTNKHKNKFLLYCNIKQELKSALSAVAIAKPHVRSGDLTCVQLARMWLSFR